MRFDVLGVGVVVVGLGLGRLTTGAVEPAPDHHKQHEPCGHEEELLAMVAAV